MSNERYLVLSYFLFGVVCLGLGLLVYFILRRPFSAIADAVAGDSRSPVLKRALMFSLTVAGVLGFLGYSYNEHGCVSYEQVIRDRRLLVEANVRQVQDATDWLVGTTLAWGVVVVICISILQKHRSKE
ncbi:MAG TPA: hypothetical protein VMU05_12845 [Dongiaceae bacterium]|nr:hypothetical protein [Dongiaceae bacterium]